MQLGESFWKSPGDSWCKVTLAGNGGGKGGRSCVSLQFHKILGLKVCMCVCVYSRTLSVGKAHDLAQVLFKVIFSDRSQFSQASLVAQLAIQETWVQFLGRKDPLEKEMATHSSILAWRIQWTKEPGRLQSTGSQESDTTYCLNHHHRFSELPFHKVVLTQ